MIADALRIEIEAHAQRVRAGNPLLRRASRGEIPPEVLGRYLVSLRYLIAHTPRCLTRACKQARAGGHHRLVEHFEHKQVEEEGHDIWAERDLAGFRATYGIEPRLEPVPAIAQLVEYIKSSIDRDPALYLAYILWAEYFTVLAGGEFVRCLVEECSVPVHVLSCLAQHVVLDEEHTEEGLEVIDDLVDDPRLLQPMREVVQRAASLFDAACEQMLATRTDPATRIAS